MYIVVRCSGSHTRLDSYELKLTSTQARSGRRRRCRRSRRQRYVCRWRRCFCGRFGRAAHALRWLAEQTTSSSGIGLARRTTVVRRRRRMNQHLLGAGFSVLNWFRYSSGVRRRRRLTKASVNTSFTCVCLNAVAVSAWNTKIPIPIGWMHACVFAAVVSTAYDAVPRCRALFRCFVARAWAQTCTPVTSFDKFPERMCTYSLRDMK